MAITPMKTMTVAELRKALEGKPDNAEVRVWLPGTRIALSWMQSSASVDINATQVLIEGNIEPGSALDV